MTGCDAVANVSASTRIRSVDLSQSSEVSHTLILERVRL